MSQSSFGGVFPVLPTVFTDRGDIDPDGMLHEEQPTADKE